LLTKDTCEAERNPVVEAAPEGNWAGESQNAKLAKHKPRALASLDWDRNLVDGDSFGQKRVLEGTDSVEETFCACAKLRVGILALEQLTCVFDSMRELNLVLERSASPDRQWPFEE
jgi:hypothetical protein